MRLVLLLVLALALAGCGAPSPKRAPDVRGQRLDIAEERLDARELDWEEIGGGNLGIVVRSHWYVCSQEPRPGTKTITVRLVVERDCATFDFQLPNPEGICYQSPPAGERATSVSLYVRRFDCD